MASIGSRQMPAREIRLIARDAVAAFVVLTVVASSIGGETSHAAPTGTFAREAPAGAARSNASAPLFEPAAAVGHRVSEPPYAEMHQPLFQGTSRRTALFLLAAVFSAVVAFNLAFLRHLARVHSVSSSRSRAWKDA